MPAKKKSAAETAIEEIKALPKDYDAMINFISAHFFTYITETDLPIAEEYFVRYGINAQMADYMTSENKLFAMCVELLETKRRAALERMIFSGELNATIGSQMLKSWREEEKESGDTGKAGNSYLDITHSELDALGLFGDEREAFISVLRKIAIIRKGGEPWQPSEEELLKYGIKS
jgi:hypothetical protein